MLQQYIYSIFFYDIPTKNGWTEKNQNTIRSQKFYKP